MPDGKEPALSVSGVCRDVRLFLDSLRSQFPGLLPRPTRPRRFRRAPRPGEAAARRAAGALIKARVAELSARLRLSYGRVFIKDQRTRWASCSSSGNLNFSWRLAAAPPEVLDYVVVHELCHLREMNHSARFWDLVRAACPDYKAMRRWLRDNAATLRSAVPAAADFENPN